MKLNSLALTGLLAAAAVALPALAAGKSMTPTDEAFTLLKGIQAKASEVEHHASDLQRVPATVGSTTTHVTALEAVKREVNDMGRMLARLEAIRDSAAPEERNMIDRASPTLKTIAANTQEAIKFLNAKPSDFWLPEYMAHIDKIEAASDQLYGTLGHFIQYEHVAAKEKRLEKTVSTETGM